MATAKKPLAGLGKKVTASSQGYSYTPPSPVKTKTAAEIEAEQKREAYEKALAADIRKVESWQPVTTYEQAVAFGKSEIGKRIPNMDNWLYNLEWSYYNYGNAKPETRERNLNYYLNLVNEAKTNLPKAMEKGLSDAVNNYLHAVRGYNLDPHPQLANTLTRYTNELNDAVKFAVEVGVSPQNIVKSLEVGQKEYTEGINRMIADLNKSDQIWGIAENLILGGLTSSLSPLNATLLNSAIALENKVPFKDVLKVAISNLTGNEVVSYLQGIQAITKDPVVNSAVSNSLRSALSAQALKQDVKTAALAGFAGGAAAGTLLKASDNAAISRAVGEYTQGLAAGMSPEVAMAQALSGFADEEVADARRKIQDQAVIEQAKIDTKKPAQDQVIEAFSQPKSPGVGTQLGEATAELAGGIQYGSRPGAQGTDIVKDVDLPSIPVKPVIPSDRDTLPGIDVVAPPGEFGADLIRPTTPSRDTDILNLTGLRPAITPPSGVSVTTPTLPDITIPTAPTAPTQPPATDQMLPEVEVTGDRDRDILNLTGLTRPTTPTTPQEPPKPSLPEVEVVGEPLEEEPVELKPDTEAETKPTKPPVEEEPGTKPTRPILLSLLNLPTAYLGDRPGEMRPGTAALAQALGVGDPGALYLGKKGKERKPVWNVESLKLKDELGGDYG